jgi:hypothetical protein
MRTLSLGWTPKLFGSRDRIMDLRNTDRDDHKTERWGKKYQWMALHELLARIADNFQPLSEYDEGPFDGLPRITWLRDIDPSLPPVNYRDLLERKAVDTPTWLTPQNSRPELLTDRIVFARYRGDAASFVADRATEPILGKVATFIDHDGSQWIALNGLEIQRENREDPERRNLEQTVWLWSAFTHSECASSVATKLKRGWRNSFRGPEARGHVNCCYAGEIGWSPRSCVHQLAGPRAIEESPINIQVLDTSEHYLWEGHGLDCSIFESVSATLPSTYVQKNAAVRMNMSGPSWVDEQGESVAFYCDFGGSQSHALYARFDWIQHFLREKDLSLLILMRVDRLLLEPFRTERHPRSNVWSSAVLEADGQLKVVGAPIRLSEMW